jgi:hypothetical protein
VHQAMSALCQKRTSLAVSESAQEFQEFYELGVLELIRTAARLRVTASKKVNAKRVLHIAASPAGAWRYGIFILKPFFGSGIIIQEMNLRLIVTILILGPLFQLDAWRVLNSK